MRTFLVEFIAETVFRCWLRSSSVSFLSPGLCFPLPSSGGIIFYLARTKNSTFQSILARENFLKHVTVQVLLTERQTAWLTCSQQRITVHKPKERARWETGCGPGIGKGGRTSWPGVQLSLYRRSRTCQWDGRAQCTRHAGYQMVASGAELQGREPFFVVCCGLERQGKARLVSNLSLSLLESI